MEFMFILWFVLAVFCGWIATQKGRSFFGWLLLGMLLSPLIALIALVAVPARQAPKPSWTDDDHTPLRRHDDGFPDLPPRRDA